MIVKRTAEEKLPFFHLLFLHISISEELCAKTAVHGLVVCDPRHLLATPQQLVIPCSASWVREWTFFGKADGLGKTRDFTWLSTVTLICVDVSQQK